ncbi:PQQ-like domain-containing protein [Fibrobacter sp. UWB10]|nr:PQQ-like domain-containing protein [Fibrobacter sp. UWB10]
MKQIGTNIRLLQLRTAITLVWLCGLVSFAFAEKMETSIQEALYLFEMKGETADAIKMLEKAAMQGDEDDKEKAYFYLGKIQELAGNKTSANFYYEQSLARTNEVAKAYWLSERESATSSKPEALLRAPLQLKSPILRTFGKDPTFLLLRDGTISKIVDDRVENITVAPANKQIFNIDRQGIWYQPIDQDSLVFKALYASSPSKSFPITDITHLLIDGNRAIVQGEKQLSILNNKRIVTQIADKYNGCVPEGYFAPTNEFVLNCTDNALHFISPEDGSTKKSIAQFDVIRSVLIDKNMLFLVSGNYLYGYIPKARISPLWKISVSNIETMFSFEKSLVLLEASGRISLIDKKTGLIRKTIRSEASSVYPLAKGTLGLFSSEGAITAVDTVLNPLWHFNFAKPIEQSPIYTNGNLYLYFGDRKLVSLSPHYYGKKILLSEIMARQAAEITEHEEWEDLPPVLDSLFKLEPGNAEGWFFKALYLEQNKGSDRDKQKAWSEAVRLSSSNPQATQLILNRFSKAIGAKFVTLLPISPKTRYPQFFSSKKMLYTIDPAADRLLCINAETGELRWSKYIGTLDNSPVIDNDENTLVIASGYNIFIYDLNKDTSPASLQLPGKAFKMNVTEDAIYVSTWNGFLLKIQKPDNKLAWSRKIFSVPFLHTKSDKTIFACNLEGELVSLDDEAGQTQENSARKIPGQVSHMLSADSIITVASGNKLYLFNQKKKDTPPLQILMENDVSSLQVISDAGERKILVGLSDQSFLLYSEAGAPLWKFNGKNAVFPKPFVKDGFAWIDQGNEVIGISLKTGKKERKYSTPGGAGTPFILNHTLFSASPKRLLYGFTL